MAISASEARAELFGLIDRVNRERTEIEITSKRGSAILMAKSEYDSLMETLYLLGSAKNARRLFDALDEANAGTAVAHELADE